MRTESDSLQNFAPGIKPTMPWRVLSVVAHPNFQLEVTFMDGLHGYVDLRCKVLDGKAGVFAKLRDPVLFNRVFVEYGVVTWPGELDLAPDTMYDQIKKNGAWVL